MPTSQQDICEAGKVLAEKGLVHSNLGTISMEVFWEKWWQTSGQRVRGRNRWFLTKPGPVYYRHATPQDFVVVDLAGNILSDEKDGPSQNWLVHQACYEARPDISAVVHAHPEHVVALISQIQSRDIHRKLEFRPLTGETIWFFKPTADCGVDIPVVPNLDPEPLAHAVKKEITRCNVVAIRNHGIIAVGKDIWEALSAALVIESEARMIATIYQMGGTPDFLSPERIRHEIEGMPPWFSPPFDVWQREN